MTLVEQKVPAKKTSLRIPPYARLTGQQLAGNWTPKNGSKPDYDIIFEPDIPIVLPDGTILRGDLYCPQGIGPFPDCAPPYLARNTLFHGGSMASYLTISVRRD